MNKNTAEDLKLAKVIGHRGACGHAPENTMASFIKAHELGVTCTEFDVQLTADNKLVIFHDLDFKRLCNNGSLLAEMDYAECGQFDVGSHFSPSFHGAVVPLLEDALRYFLEVGITPNIEVKSNGLNSLDVARELTHLLSHLWPHDRMPPLLSSFDHQILEAVRSHDKNLPIGVLWEKVPSDWRKTTTSLDAHSVITDYITIDEDLIQDIHSESLPLACYTLNETERARHLFSIGVDAIITDYPERIFAACSNR